MSERKLCMSYGSPQKWKDANGRPRQYIRWDFSTPKEQWLRKNKLTEQWLFKNLEWMIGGGEIAYIKKADENRLYYIVTTQRGEEHYLVFEQTKAVNSLVLIFEDHWQTYYYRGALCFDFEEYDCFQNGISSISFSHGKSNDSTHISSIIVGGKIHLEFYIQHNLPVWKVLSDYSSLFTEISKYNLDSIEPFDKKQWIATVVKIAKMFGERKSEEIIRFGVVFDLNHEWFDIDSSGISMKARLRDGGNYVICREGAPTEWLGQYSTGRSYKVKDGVIVDGKNEKVTDTKLAKTIISDIREAKRLFYQMKQEFMLD